MTSTLLALPRSGTAWAAMWLGFVHDPLDRYSPAEAAALPGVCCTASWLFPRLLRKRVGPTAILVRDVREVNASLDACGMDGCITDTLMERFERAEGVRFPWTDLWEKPEPIWDLLRPDAPFDAQWHKHLSRFNIQINFAAWQPTLSIEELKTWA